jgi:Flp pilus assembly protein TadD
MAEHSPEQGGGQEPGGVPETLGPDGQEGNPLAQAFRRLRKGRGREAANLYQDIMKPRQTPIMAHIERGIQNDELGRHELAIEEFLAAQKLEPDNVEAEVQLKTICDRNPSHGPAHFYRGEALNRLDRVDEALRIMERTIQLQPRNWRAYHTLGMLFDRKEDPERASAMYRQARELNHL